MITIVDYGMGNLGSIQNMFKKIGEKSIVSSNKHEIAKATKILLPGVGSFDHAMKNLNDLDLIDIIKEKVLIEKIPILGICLGMQILTNGSEEGKCKGLSIIEANVNKFNFTEIDMKLPVPHMGWNKVKVEKNSKLFSSEMDIKTRFYFVHSYAVSCVYKEDVLSSTNYGYEFTSSFEKDNVIGCQFHPEKSHKFGMQLLKNFIKNY